MGFNVGDIVEGKITGITSFGVFADIGEGKSGMVHISEIARDYVNDIKEHVKEGDVVKMKVLNIGADGKIALSIKRALPPEKKVRAEGTSPRRDKKSAPAKQNGIDSTYTWTPKKSDSSSFEEMMNRFKQTSDEKFSDLKRKNPDANRTKRNSGVR